MLYRIDHRALCTFGDRGGELSGQKAHILVVDDQLENLLILEDMLAGQYRVTTATDGAEALRCLGAEGSVDLVLLDAVMPGMDGFDTCKVIKDSPLWSAIPVLFLTSLDGVEDETRALSLGAEDFIHKPFSAPVIKARVRTHLNLAAAMAELQNRNVSLEQTVAERTSQVLKQSAELNRRAQQLVAAQSATISAFCSLAEVRDNETGNHILRTQNYVRCVAEALKSHPRFRAELSDANIYLMFKSAPLHDIGKVAIPDQILLKPGPLTDKEWVVMRRHCEYGRSAIEQAELALGDEADSFLHYAREIAYCHHEKWDGSGYPCGLSGDAIPVSARLMAVADVYDALISRRVYKPPFSHEKAVKIITESRGTHFDPDVVDAFLAVEEEFREIATKYQDEAAVA